MAAPESTDAIAKATGIAWTQWIARLDQAGGTSLSHREIVAAALPRLGHVDNPAWWAQSVAVAYEQQIGRRVPGQRQDGSFEATASRTHGATLDEAIEAWGDLVAAADGVGGVPFAGDASETATAGYRRWRATLTDGTRLLAQASLRGDRAVLTATWERLPDADTRDARRVALKELLGRLS